MKEMMAPNSLTCGPCGLQVSPYHFDHVRGGEPLSQLLPTTCWYGRSLTGGPAVGLLLTWPPLVKFTVKKGGETSGLPKEPHGSPIIYWKQ